MRAPAPAAVWVAGLALLGGLVAIADTARPQPLAAGGGSVIDVDRVTLVCPAVTSIADVSVSTIAAAAEVGDGTLRLEPLGAEPSAAPLAQAAAGAAGLRYAVPPGPAAPRVLRATGQRARGLTATTTTRTADGSGRGISSGACTTSGNEHWFVGAGAVAGQRAYLHLVNPDAAAAVVDVTVFTASGPKRPTPGQGVLVAPGSEIVLPLDALVPGEAATVVQVRSRSGRVAASLVDTVVSGLEPGGVDWVPPTQPGDDLVVPGVPPAADATRTLQILVPGEEPTTVRLRLLTADGTIAPVGLDTIDVTPGQLVSVPLTAELASGALAVRLTAERPVVAGVRLVRSRSGTLPDLAYAAAAPALTVAGAVPVAVTGGPVATTLLLTNTTESDVAVRLTTRPWSGAAPSQTTVSVRAGTTQPVPVGVAAPGAAVVVEVAPGVIGVHAGWLWSETGARGPLVSGQPVLSGARQVVVPAVRPDPAAGLAG